MRLINITLIFGFLILGCKSKIILSEGCSSAPVNHKTFHNLLQKHVSKSGDVDYKGFIADSLEFNGYLSTLEKNHPTQKWTDNERLAYWINAYNAYTIQLIMRNYPVNSIKDLGGSIYQVNTSWDINFINICGQNYNLNNIEHGKIRKQFDEPRIHFAVNCASVSCPKLFNEAFSADQLEQQLEQVTKEFINNSSKNKITEEKASLSKIFKWYSGDFKTKHSTVIDFVNKYSEAQITDNTEINYMDYDWNLNDKQD